MAMQNADQDADKKAVVNIANGVITGVTPPGIKMGTKRKQHIEWSIESEDRNVNYTFPGDGIVIKSDPNGQFYDGGKVTGDDTKYKWHDNNSDTISYKYTVNVMNGTTPLKPLDPTIDNGQ